MFSKKLVVLSGDQLVTLQKSIPIHGNPAIFDTIFAPKRKIKNPGVYAVFFDDQLLYIGKYQGKKIDPFAGDVVRERWAKHLATMTCRGKSLSMAKQTLRSSRAIIQEHSYDTPLADALSTCDQAVTETDRGCVTVLPRVRFALERSDAFSEALPSSLGRFHFVYLTVPSSTDEGAREIRNRISEIEDQLITYLQPILNIKGVRKGLSNINLSSGDYSKLLVRIAGLAPIAKTLNDEDVIGLSSKFFQDKEVLRPLEESFERLLNWLEAAEEVDYYFTNTPDFRVKAKVNGKNRVVSTLKFLPKKQGIRLRTLLPIDCPDLVGRKINDTLPWEYHVDTRRHRKATLATGLDSLLSQVKYH